MPARFVRAADAKELLARRELSEDALDDVLWEQVVDDDVWKRPGFREPVAMSGGQIGQNCRVERKGPAHLAFEWASSAAR